MKNILGHLLVLFFVSTGFSETLAHKINFVVEKNDEVLVKMHITTSDGLSNSVKNTRREDWVEIEVTPSSVKTKKGSGGVSMKIKFSYANLEAPEKANHEVTVLGFEKRESIFSFKDNSGKNTFKVTATPEKIGIK